MGKTVVLGCGSLLAADDAVGLRAVEELKKQHLPDWVRVIEAGTPGLGLLDLILDADKAIIVDAVISGRPPGTVLRLDLEELTPDIRVPWSLHGIGLKEALLLGKQLEPARMPRETIIIAMEVADVSRFKQGLSPEVERAVPELVRAIMEEILASA